MAGRTRRTPKRPEDWEAFLAQLRERGNVRDSCLAAGVGRVTAYGRRKQDAAFAEAWNSALDDATDDLELEARRRARDGVRRVKFHQGQPILIPVPGPDGRPLLGDDGQPVLAPYVEHEYSDTLLIFLLKANRPEK